jgi:hypothetical protein
LVPKKEADSVFITLNIITVSTHGQPDNEALFTVFTIDGNADDESEKDKLAIYRIIVDEGERHINVRPTSREYLEKRLRLARRQAEFAGDTLNERATHVASWLYDTLQRIPPY